MFAHLASHCAILNCIVSDARTLNIPIVEPSYHPGGTEGGDSLGPWSGVEDMASRVGVLGLSPGSRQTGMKCSCDIFEKCMRILSVKVVTRYCVSVLREWKDVCRRKRKRGGFECYLNRMDAQVNLNSRSAGKQTKNGRQEDMLLWGGAMTSPRACKMSDGITPELWLTPPDESYLSACVAVKSASRIHG